MSIDKTWRADTGVKVTDLPADFEELKRLATRQGWLITKQGNGHWKFLPPKGQPCYASATPSDPDWLWAFRRRLKQNGLKPDSNVKVTNGAKQQDKLEYFTMPAVVPPQENRVMPKTKRTGYGQLKQCIIDALKKQQSGYAYPEDIVARVQIDFPNMDIQRLKVTMNGYASTGSLVKTEAGKYSLPQPVADPNAGYTPSYGVTRQPPVRIPDPPPPASEEDLKVLENLLTALADAECVIRKHIDIQRQLGALSSLLGRQLAPIHMMSGDTGTPMTGQREPVKEETPP